MENAEANQQMSEQDELRSCRRQLIEDGLLSEENGQYFVTEKGKQRVHKELDRYKFMPARLVLIQHFILEQNGLAVE